MEISNSIIEIKKKYRKCKKCFEIYNTRLKLKSKNYQDILEFNGGILPDDMLGINKLGK